MRVCLCVRVCVRERSCACEWIFVKKRERTRETERKLLQRKTEAKKLGFFFVLVLALVDRLQRNKIKVIAEEATCWVRERKKAQQ